MLEIKRAVELEPGIPDPHANLGWVYKKRKCMLRQSLNWRRQSL
jgi:hypothetical protein